MNFDTPKRRWLQWLFKGPWWWRAWLGLVGIILLASVFYAEEDWRGQKCWNDYRRSMEAAGISVDLQYYIPKTVPDDENFAMSPIFKDWMKGTAPPLLTNDLYARADDYIWATNNPNAPAHRHFVDLVAWQQAADDLKAGTLGRKQPVAPQPVGGGKLNPKPHFSTDKTDLASRAEAAPTVLEGMKPDEAEFSELRSASSLPYSRFPILYRMDDPSQILLPHLARIKQVCQRLHLQMCAKLAAGQTDQALADVKLSLRLNDSTKTEPVLISFLVRIACFQICTQTVWEGLAERRWTDAQLRELESCFGGYDFLRDGWDVLKCERAFGVREIEVTQKKGLGSLLYIASSTPDPQRSAFLNLLGQAMPQGWFELEKLNYCTIFDAKLAEVLNPSEKRVFHAPSSPRGTGEPFDLEPASFSPGLILQHKVFAAWLTGILQSISRTIAMPQTSANQATIACALERYRLANGQFPEALISLVPQFIERLPDDVITGEPYKYHRTADGQFVLYSVGWNQKDDGGVSGKLLFDPSEGDWVWEYPAQ